MNGCHPQLPEMNLVQVLGILKHKNDEHNHFNSFFVIPTCTQQK